MTKLVSVCIHEYSTVVHTHGRVHSLHAGAGWSLIVTDRVAVLYTSVYVLTGEYCTVVYAHQYCAWLCVCESLHVCNTVCVHRLKNSAVWSVKCS